MAWGLFRKIKDGIKRGINKIKDIGSKAFGLAKKALPTVTNLANQFAPQIASNPKGAALLGGLNAANAALSNSDSSSSSGTGWGPLLSEKLRLK